MKVVFYSDQCEYSKKMLAYLDKYNIRTIFNLINVDHTVPPKEIDMVPTIIDSELNKPLKGKKAFEYLLNLKYFNNPTNNIELVKDITNPEIKEDELAQTSNTNNLEITTTTEKPHTPNVSETFHENNKTGDVGKSTQTMVNMRNDQDKMFALLARMKR